MSEYIQPKQELSWSQKFQTPYTSTTLVSNQSSTHCSHRSRRASNTGVRPETRLPCLHRTTRITFQLKRRPELCLSTSQQPTTAYGTVASPARCCNCCLIDTWSILSRRWLAIAALPLPPEMAKGAGYDASRMVSLSDLHWHPFSSTAISLTCQSPSPESMHMLTT